MHYRAFNEAMRARFGTKVYKLALDGGMTCPNRDGTLSARGCIFCSEKGSGDFAAPYCADLETQIEAAKMRVRHKLGQEGQYIAYFQSFTNTYAPLAYLEALFGAVIAREDIAGLAIATRPDCLSDEIVALLQALGARKPVWLELGLQTVHAESARYIRRGYALDGFEAAMARLQAAGLEVVVHMILGLPGEGRTEILETARYIGQSGAAGIKLQLLHILEGTDLAQEYRAGRISALAREDYIALLGDCLRHLPPDMVIHRLTGDGDKRNLLAPLWSADKKRVLEAIRQSFALHDVRQGSLFVRTEASL